MKKPKAPFIDPSAILKALKGHTRECPLKVSPDMEQILKIPITKNRGDRVRKVIAKLVKDGYPIGSNSRGFFMIDTYEDNLRCMNAFISRAISNVKRAEDVRQSYNATDPSRKILKQTLIDTIMQLLP